jgi:hypothetical protein
MSDPLFPGAVKLAMFGGAVTAIWTISGMPPAPWWVRMLFLGFFLSMAYVVAHAVNGLYPSLPAGVYGVVGALVPVVVINLLVWVRKASNDPIGTIKSGLDAWRGGNRDGN